MVKGNVVIIGAGPGDPELLTIKAVKALQRADVVLVDDLVNPEILAHCPQAKIVPVGKRGGCKSTPQKFINRMMVALAERGQVVVRLKGGDPFMFGRGGEEMLELREVGIPYQVIPGITSGMAGASSVEVPLTHRDFTHGVTFITGHVKDNGDPIPWASLVESQTTLVIYMGMKHLSEISRHLIEAGMLPETPALIVQRGTLDDQRALTCTVETLPWAAHQHAMKSPSIVVVGNVVALANPEALIQEAIHTWPAIAVAGIA